MTLDVERDSVGAVALVRVGGLDGGQSYVSPLDNDVGFDLGDEAELLGSHVHFTGLAYFRHLLTCI